MLLPGNGTSRSLSHLDRSDTLCRWATILSGKYEQVPLAEYTPSWYSTFFSTIFKPWYETDPGQIKHLWRIKPLSSAVRSPEEIQALRDQFNKLLQLVTWTLESGLVVDYNGVNRPDGNSAGVTSGAHWMFPEILISISFELVQPLIRYNPSRVTYAEDCLCVFMLAETILHELAVSLVAPL